VYAVLAVGIFMVITVLLSCGKGVKYCSVWSQFSLDVCQTCLVLLSMKLPSLLQFMGHNYLNNLLKQAIHTSFYLSHSVNVAEFHALRYPWYVLLQPNSLAETGKGALCAPWIWFLISCMSDIHLPTSTWYTPYIWSFQAYFSLSGFLQW